MGESDGSVSRAFVSRLSRSPKAFLTFSVVNTSLQVLERVDLLTTDLEPVDATRESHARSMASRSTVVRPSPLCVLLAISRRSLSSLGSADCFAFAATLRGRHRLHLPGRTSLAPSMPTVAPARGVVGNILSSPLLVPLPSHPIARRGRAWNLTVERAVRQTSNGVIVGSERLRRPSEGGAAGFQEPSGQARLRRARLPPLQRLQARWRRGPGRFLRDR